MWLINITIVFMHPAKKHSFYVGFVAQSLKLMNLDLIFYMNNSQIHNVLNVYSLFPRKCHMFDLFDITLQSPIS